MINCVFFLGYLGSWLFHPCLKHGFVAFKITLMEIVNVIKMMTTSAKKPQMDFVWTLYQQSELF